MFIKKIGAKFQNRTKHYSKNDNGIWRETIVTKDMIESEVPEEYRDYDLNEEFDLTPELEMQLKS